MRDQHTAGYDAVQKHRTKVVFFERTNINMSLGFTLQVQIHY